MPLWDVSPVTGHCYPKAHRGVFAAQIPAVQVRAVRAVQPGEELCVNYFGARLGLVLVSVWLWSMWCVALEWASPIFKARLRGL